MLQGEHSSILSTFFKLPFVIKIFVMFIFEWSLKIGFTIRYDKGRWTAVVPLGHFNSFIFKQDKEFVKDLPLVYTTPEKAVLASVFNISEHPTIGTLLGKAATDIDMDSALVQLKPKQSPTHCLSAKLFERK